MCLWVPVRRPTTPGQCWDSSPKARFILFNSTDYFPHNLIYSVHSWEFFFSFNGKKKRDNKSQRAKFSEIRYSCFKKTKRWRAASFLCDSRRVKEKQRWTLTSEPTCQCFRFHQRPQFCWFGAKCLWNVLTKYVFVCVYFVLLCFWKNRESNTFKGWRKFSSIYLGQWNIHHTETQTLHRIKDQRSYTSRRSKNRCLRGYQTSNGLSTAPLTPLPSPTDRTELGGPPHGTCQPPKCD